MHRNWLWNSQTGYNADEGLTVHFPRNGHNCTALTPVFLSFLQQGQHRRYKMTPTLPRRNGQLDSVTPLRLRLSLLVLLLSAGPHGAICLDFSYHDARDLHDFLVNVTHTYPSITRLYSAGKSVQGGSLSSSLLLVRPAPAQPICRAWPARVLIVVVVVVLLSITTQLYSCLLYTSPSPRDRTTSRMPSSA